MLKISDFGLAYQYDPSKTVLPIVAKLVGPQSYYAPENEKHGRLSHGQDVYAAGLTAWQIFYQKSNLIHFPAFKSNVKKQQSSNPVNDAINKATESEPKLRISAAKAHTLFSDAKKDQKIQLIGKEKNLSDDYGLINRGSISFEQFWQ